MSAVVLMEAEDPVLRALGGEGGAAEEDKTTRRGVFEAVFFG